MVKRIKEIRPLDGMAVRCEADRCEDAALFLLVAAGASRGLWAYCEEHARIRARAQNLELPATSAAALAAC